MHRPKHACTPHCLAAPDQHVYENILYVIVLVGVKSALYYLLQGQDTHTQANICRERSMHTHTHVRCS